MSKTTHRFSACNARLQEDHLKTGINYDKFSMRSVQDRLH